MEPIKIYYCYTPQDKKLRGELDKHLMALKRLGQITLRLNREIIAGTNWSHVEDRHFQAADLILLLISPFFISSDYHYGIEMRHALEKHEAGNVWVIPIILRPTLWEQTPIGKLQALPRGGKAITEQRNRDAAFVDIVKEISRVVATLLTRRQEISFATKADGGKFPKFTQVIGSSCTSCGARNPFGVIICENCGDLLLTTAVTPQVSPQALPKATLPPRPVQASRAALNVAQAGNAQAAYRLGLQFMNSKNYAEAVNQFKMAQVPGNSSYDVLYNLGRAYRLYGQSVKDKDKNLFTENMKFSAEYFEQAVALKPNAVDAYFQLGMTYHNLGLFDKATTAFKNVLQFSPQDSAIHYQLGTVAMDQFYDWEAEAYFLEGLKINPHHVLILVALGRIYIRMNQTSAAISVLRQVTQRDPAMWEGWYELGLAHMKAKEWKLALSALEQARQLNFEEANIYSAMANCYLNTNKKAEARQMIRESLQRDSNNVEANRLLRQL